MLHVAATAALAAAVPTAECIVAAAVVAAAAAAAATADGAAWDCIAAAKRPEVDHSCSVRYYERKALRFRLRGRWLTLRTPKYGVYLIQVDYCVPVQVQVLLVHEFRRPCTCTRYLVQITTHGHKL